MPRPASKKFLAAIAKMREQERAPNPKPKSGQCDVCGYRARLRVDGTIGNHWICNGSNPVGHYCTGAGAKPRSPADA